MLWVISFVVLWLLWAAWVIWGPDAKRALIVRAQRTPYFDLPGYMNRSWLVPYSRCDEPGCGPLAFRERPLAWLLQRMGVAIRVHEILRSDEGRAPHNHPWSFLSIILFGWYREERYDEDGALIAVKLYGPGSIIWRPYGTHHRLELHDGPVYTLFITFRKRGSWGFVVDGEHVNWRDYKGRQ